MIIKVKGRPYFFVIIRRLLKKTISSAWHVNNGRLMTKEVGVTLDLFIILNTLVCMHFGTPSLLSFQFL